MEENLQTSLQEAEYASLCDEAIALEKEAASLDMQIEDKKALLDEQTRGKIEALQNEFREKSKEITNNLIQSAESRNSAHKDFLANQKEFEETCARVEELIAEVKEESL